MPKLAIDGEIVDFGQPDEGTSFETDDSLTLNEGVLGVSTPVQGVLSQEEFDKLPEEEKSKGMYVIPDGSSGSEVLSVEEYDTDDGWHVRKYSDGYIEMIIHVSKSVTANDWTEWGTGGLWNVDISDHIQFPVNLIKKYCEQYSADQQQHAIFLAPAGGSNKNPLEQTNSYFGSRGSKPVANSTLGMAITVVGRWK